MRLQKSGSSFVMTNSVNRFGAGPWITETSDILKASPLITEGSDCPYILRPELKIRAAIPKPTGGILIGL